MDVRRRKAAAISALPAGPAIADLAGAAPGRIWQWVSSAFARPKGQSRP